MTKVTSSVPAIRIDGEYCVYGERHIDLLTKWQKERDFSDEEIDSLIEDGKIEFGCGFAYSDRPFQFYPDKTRISVYSSIDEMISINGRGKYR